MNRSQRGGSKQNSVCDANEFNLPSPNTGMSTTQKLSEDYPKFIIPAKYYPYRRLEEYHVADVLLDARKRHEEKLLNIKNEDTKYNEMFFKDVEENKRRTQDLEFNRKKVYEEHQK